MNLSVGTLASVPLGLLLTGCPLTDHYQLQQEDPAGVQMGGRSGDDPPMAGAPAALGGSETGGAAVAAAGAASVGGGDNFTSGGGGGDVEAGGNGGGETVCTTACNVERACVANSCTSGWVGMAAPPAKLEARSKAASVAMGKAVFVWGGQDNDGVALNNGAIYDPTLDVWTYLLPDAGSPSPRIMATAVWTGSSSNKVIVYGGTDASGSNTFKDGAVFDVAGNSWTQLPPNSMISKRSAPFGYWDGTRAVFFGGLNGVNMLAAADRFDLKAWSTSTNMGDPGLLGYSAIAVDGTVMYLQGGVIGTTRQDKVYAYTSSSDSWASLSKSLSVRTGAFAAWDGTHFVVWGGQDDVGLRSDGKAMSGMTWSDMTPSGAFSARRIGFRRSGWAFQVKPGVIAMLGGQTSIDGSSDTLATDGATYTVESGQWTAIPEWPSLETHEYGIGVWTGEEFVVWGGRNHNVSTLTGERWAP